MKKNRRTIILLILCTLGSVISLTSTATGLRVCLWFAKAVIPTQFSYGKVEGRLISNFSIQDVYFRDAYSQVTIQRISSKWSIGEILQKKLTFFETSIDNGEIILMPAPEGEPAKSSDNSYGIDFHLIFQQLKLNNLKVDIYGQQYYVHESKISFFINDDKLEVGEISARTSLGKLNLNGNLSLSTPFTHDIHTRISLDFLQSPLILQGTIKGDGTKLTVQQKISGDSTAQIELEVNDLLDKINWRGNVTIEKSGTLEKFLDSREALTGSIKTQGDLNLFTINSQLSSKIDGQHYNLVLNTVTENMQNWVLKTLSLRSDHMNLFGSGYYSEEHGYGINTYWDKFNWHLPEIIEIKSKKGKFSLSGKAEKYRYQLNGDIIIPKILPASEWAVKGNGSTQDLFVEEASINVMKGKLRILSAIDWSDNLQWTGSIITQGIDLSYYLPELKSRINSEFALYGTHDEKGIQSAGVNVVEISGRINRAKLEGHGNIAYFPDRIVIDDVTLLAGKNKFSAKGKFAKQSDFQLDLDLPELNSINRSYSGKVTAQAVLTEKNQRSKLTGNLQADKLHISSTQINKATLKYDINILHSLFALKDMDFEAILLALNHSLIEIHMDHAKIPGLRKPIRRGELVVKKSTPLTSLSLNIDAEFGKALARLNTKHDGKLWLGQVDSLKYTDLQLGTWSNKESGGFKIDSNTIEFSDFCLSQSDQSICFSGKWGDQSTELLAGIKNFSISSLSDFLPKNLFLSTIISQAKLDLRSREDQWSGNLEMDTSEGQITYLMPNGEFLSFSHHRAKLSAKMKDNDITSFVSLPITEGLGELKTQIKLEQEPQIKLGTNIQLDNINNFVSVIPELQDTKGRLDVKLNINDILNTPKFSGSLNFSQGSTRIPRLGLILSDVSLVLDTKNQDYFHLTGNAKSDKGVILLDSQISTHLDENWNLKGSFKGNNFLAANMPEYRVVSSPNLTLLLKQDSASLSGQISIPSARLNPRDLSSATMVSEDEVIVDQNNKNTATRPFKMSSNIRLYLGKDVKFEGFGLKCNLEGDLKLIDQPNAPTTASGEIRIEKGKYQAYSQNFDIQTGKLLYAGGPVGNPAILLTAYRQIKEVKVGVEVRGTLLAPVLKLVSEPVMDESDILSYLIFERPIGQINSEEQGKDLQKLALEVIGNEFLAGKIGKKLGLEDIRLQSSESTDPESGVNRDISLVVGKYLSPKLYVSYGVGLIEHAQSLNVRYNITKKLSFEASKGTEAGGDFIFTIERDKK